MAQQGKRAVAAVKDGGDTSPSPLQFPRSVHPENTEVDAWLATEEAEAVLEPELEIVDAHHHLWDRRTPAPWFTYRTKYYGAAELAHEIMLSGHNVVSTVFVQSGSFHLAEGPPAFRPCGEVEYCQGVAAQCDSGVYAGVPRMCSAIQGYIDLHDASAPAVVARMAGSRNFRGVRGTAPYDEAFKHGLSALVERGLVLDRWPSNVDELPQIAALAKEFPAVTIVLNHLGGTIGPKLAGDTEQLAKWRAGIEELGACANVVAKLGGTAMVACGHGLEQRPRPIGSDELLELTFAFYEHVVRTFGAARCMFESNFPVERDCVSYRTLWNTFKKIAAKLGLSDAEKADVFAGTARRVYKLEQLE